MNYNTQCFDDTTIQHFMWGDLSELKLENNKGSGSGSLQVRDQVTLIYEKLVCLRSHIWIQSLCCWLPQIYILYLEPISRSRKKGSKGRILILIPWMIINLFSLPIRHVYQTIRYYYNEQQIVW